VLDTFNVKLADLMMRRGGNMKYFIIAAVSVLVGYGPAKAADCKYDSSGSNEVSCPPGSHLVKNGPGQWTVYLKDGSYSIEMDGEGSVCLKGISDYSNVTGHKNGKGILYWNPKDKANAAPPSIDVYGPGGVARSNC
jgi:hypothetical protein